MRFVGPLIFVDDVLKSKEFYQKLLNEQLLFDIGASQQFASGLTLQARETMDVLFGIKSTAKAGRDFILYFETEEFDRFLVKLYEYDVKYLNGSSEPWQYEWGQRAIRFFDPDDYLIEVGEAMSDVIRRFFAQGLCAQDIADCTELPIEYVEGCLK